MKPWFCSKNDISELLTKVFLSFDCLLSVKPLYKEKTSMFFPLSRLPGENIEFDMRLCDWDDDVFGNYDIIKQYCQRDVPQIISVVGVSGCGKSSTLLRTVDFYTMLFDAGSNEMNDQTTRELIFDIDKLYADFSLGNNDVYITNDMLCFKAVDRCKINVVAKLFYLRKLLSIDSKLKPIDYRDGQLNGGQKDIKKAIFKKISIRNN